VNAVIGLLAMAVTMALAPAISAFYGEPRLLGVTLLHAVGFLFGGTAVQHAALLQRQMQFATIAVVDLASMLLGIAVGVTFAFLHFGYWSLVFMQLATTIANSFGIWIACPWRPGLPQRGTDVRSQLKFGGNLAGFNILNYLQRNVDNLIVGKMAGPVLGPAALGLYGKAYQLLMLPVNQISTPMSNVAVPALSRLQKEPERYRSYYRKAIEMITCVSMPIVVMLFVLADDLILTLLGPKFQSASIIFRWLVPAAFIGTFNVATGWVYTSLGRTDRQMLMALVVTPITIGGFFLGAWLGRDGWGGAQGVALGVAASFSATTVILRWPTIVYCFRGTPVNANDLLAAIARPVGASIGAGVGLYIIDRFLLDPYLRFAWLRLSIGGAIYAALYVLAWFVLPGGRQFIRDSRDLFKELMGKKTGGGGPKPPALSEILKKAADEPLPPAAATVKVA
jgi:O-antigen/teichoic acid export membrane protein